MGKQIDKTVEWKRISEHLSIGSKTIRQSYCQWLSLLKTMPRILALVISRSNSIMAITPKSCSKKMSTLTQDLALLTN